MGARRLDDNTLHTHVEVTVNLPRDEGSTPSASIAYDQPVFRGPAPAGTVAGGRLMRNAVLSRHAAASDGPGGYVLAAIAGIFRR